jgi:dTMP kinase
MADGGWFITFEGGEGTGKSTQLDRLAGYLTERGLDVVRTREPGGTPLAEAVRAVAIDPRFAPDGLCELYLMEAARRDHVVQLIRPALERPAVVLCDRFADSSTVYQGMVRGLGEQVVEHLNAQATGGLQPDLTLVLDLEPAAALQRARHRNRRTASTSRFDDEAEPFHGLVRQGFLRLADRHADRFRVIDASGAPDEIHRRIVAELPEALR